MSFPIENYMDNGFALLKGFLSEKEADALRKEGERIVENMPDRKNKAIHSTTNYNQSRDDYYLQSYNKLSYFYEADALGPNGELLVDKSVCLCKLGHGVHFENEVFRRVIFEDRVKSILRYLKFKEPGLLQSMVNFKNPGVGSVVSPHQDATYLYSEPSNLLGFWIALEDATLENGCLWFLPGSHRNGIHRRNVRNPDKSSPDLFIFDRPMPEVDRNKFVPVPAKKGDCVILHGSVIHLSEPNKSKKSRHSYIFHVTEENNTKWLDDNWIQRPPEGFQNVYNTVNQ